MIIWVFPSIVAAGVLLVGFLRIRRDQQHARALIAALVPVRDSE
jgi:hypothetical protein